MTIEHQSNTGGDAGDGKVSSNQRVSKQLRFRPKRVIVAEIPLLDVTLDGAPTVIYGDDFARGFLRVGLVMFAVMLVLLSLTFFNVKDQTGALLNAFTIRFLSLFIEAAPYLLLGTLVSGLIDTFISADHIARWVPRNTFLGILVGTFAGFAFPVCECGVVPVVRQLYTKQLPMSVGIAFLLAAPVMNPIVLLSTWSTFGFGPVLIGRYLITTIVTMGASLVFALTSNRLQLQSVYPMPASPMGPSQITGTGSDAGSVRQNLRLTARLGSALHIAVDEFYEMGRYLVIGSLLAAGMQTIVSQDILISLGQGPIVSVLVMQLLAFVLSVCSTVDAFMALAFSGTFSTGSILAFLTFGPMVDIKSTIMFLGVFKRKTVVLLVFLPMAMTGVIAVAFNFVGIK